MSEQQNKVCYTLSGQEVVLQDQNILASGGEADVYVSEHSKDILLKIFTRENISILNKLKIFLLSKKNSFTEYKDKDNSKLSFPLLPLFAKQSGNGYDDIVGYAMYRKAGKSLHSQINPIKIKSGVTLKNTKRSDLVKALIDVLQEIQKLHNKGVIVGDLSLRNILYDDDTKNIALIDNDSFQFILETDKHTIDEITAQLNKKRLVKSKKRIEEDKKTFVEKFFPCEVSTMEYTAPEIFGENLLTVKRTVEIELFGIAVLIFQVLMLGKHPYSSKVYSDTEEAMKAGFFPYDVNYNLIKQAPNGDWVAIWSHLPHGIQDLFVEALDKKTHRASIDEWLNALCKYHKYLLKNKHKDKLFYQNINQTSSRNAQQNLSFDTNDYVLDLQMI